METTIKSRVQKAPIENKAFLNEAYDYESKVSFVRGISATA